MSHTVSAQQTLVLLTNCPKYTPKIRGIVALMQNEARVRTTKKYSSLPTALSELKSLGPLFSQDSQLEFSTGELYLGKLKDCFNGAIHYSGESKESHRQNYDACAKLLLAH